MTRNPRDKITTTTAATRDMLDWKNMAEKGRALTKRVSAVWFKESPKQRGKDVRVELASGKTGARGFYSKLMYAVMV